MVDDENIKVHLLSNPGPEPRRKRIQPASCVTCARVHKLPRLLLAVDHELGGDTRPIQIHHHPPSSLTSLTRPFPRSLIVSLVRSGKLRDPASQAASFTSSLPRFDWFHTFWPQCANDVSCCADGLACLQAQRPVAAVPRSSPRCSRVIP